MSMSTTRYGTLIGLALGAVLAVTGNVWLTLVAGLFGVVGYVVGLVLEGRIAVDVDAVLRPGRRQTPPEAPPVPRSRADRNLQ